MGGGGGGGEKRRDTDNNGEDDDSNDDKKKNARTKRLIHICSKTCHTHTALKKAKKKKSINFVWRYCPLNELIALVHIHVHPE